MPRARRINAQFLEWLKELRDQYEEGDNMRMVYGKAFNSLKNETKEYTTPNQLLEVKGIGKKTVAVLEERYAMENGGVASQPAPKPRGRPVKRSATDLDVEPPPPAKRRTASAAVLPTQVPQAINDQFRFCYLDGNEKRVLNCADAETTWDVNGRLKMRVAFPISQATHPLAAQLYEPKRVADTVFADMWEDVAEQFPQCPGFKDQPAPVARKSSLLTMLQDEATKARSTSSLDPSRQLPSYLNRSTNAVASGSRDNVQSSVPAQSDMRSAATARSYESLSQGPSAGPHRPLVRAATTTIPTSSSISAALQRTTSAPAVVPTRARLSHAVPGLPPVERLSLYAPQTTFDPFNAKIFKAGQYDICLLLDTREKGGKSREDYGQALRGKGLNVQTRTLEVGDVAWVAISRLDGSECMLDVVLERKRLDDLVASVKDGRFHEQKFRLHQSAISRVFFLVEDYDVRKNMEEWGPMIKTSLSSTQVVDGFLVKETKNINDTISFLAGLHEELCRMHQNKDLYVIPKDMIKRYSYVDLQRYLRREKPGQCFVPSFQSYQWLNHKSQFKTVRDTWARMLLCVKGMSPEKVGAVIERWGTPRELWEAFRDAQKEEDKARRIEAAEQEAAARGPAKGKGRKKKSNVLEAQLMLQGVGGAEGGMRAIGPTLSMKLYELFMAMEYDD
ncbi:hypothetical protein FB45DRAFT_907731 [Roridomyces roridus]|uniref:Crossover junction endonuclease MUS81 n=1 Tax=Roridomyces roridus TaxID=1738132 RepID=A0AAD7C2J1_9AGAR|nr:hypothetical protein FB45DRAFT_907731 [Roridomyces roridus]